MQRQLTQEQVPQDIRWLSELVGMEHFVKILDMAGGETIYFPKRESLERPLRRQAIRQEFDGYNYHQLARKYGLTERSIRHIIKQGEVQ